MCMSMCEDEIDGRACRGGNALKAGLYAYMYSCTHCPLWYVQTYNNQGMVLEPL